MDTCSTCEKWICLSRKSQIGGCEEDDAVWMDRNDCCGAWEVMEEPMKAKTQIVTDKNEKTAAAPILKEPEPVEEPALQYPSWQDFYNPSSGKIEHANSE